MEKELVGVEFRSNTFFYFLQECQLAQALLFNGLENILQFSKSPYSYEAVGYGYKSFFNLSISIERLSKLALIFNYAKLHSKGDNPIVLPRGNDIRKQGHDLSGLFGKLGSELKNEEPDNKRFSLSPISERILKFLSNFASKSRYENLDRLSGDRLSGAGSSTDTDEPLKVWEEILKEIINSEIIGSKESYESMAKVADKTCLGASHNLSSEAVLVSFVRDYHGVTRSLSELNLFAEAYCKYYPCLLWHIFQIINPIIFVLNKWARETYTINEEYVFLPFKEALKEKYTNGIEPSGEIYSNPLDVPEVWQIFSDPCFEALDFPQFLECLKWKLSNNTSFSDGLKPDRPSETPNQTNPK